MNPNTPTLIAALRDAATEAINATAAANSPMPAPGVRRHEVEAHAELTLAINAVEAALLPPVVAESGPAHADSVESPREALPLANADAKDAARYRWLRLYAKWIYPEIFNDEDWQGSLPEARAKLDEAIDRQLASLSKSEPRQSLPLDLFSPIGAAMKHYEIHGSLPPGSNAKYPSMRTNITAHVVAGSLRRAVDLVEREHVGIEVHSAHHRGAITIIEDESPQ